MHYSKQNGKVIKKIQGIWRFEDGSKKIDLSIWDWSRIRITWIERLSGDNDNVPIITEEIQGKCKIEQIDGANYIVIPSASISNAITPLMIADRKIELYAVDTDMITVRFTTTSEEFNRFNRIM